MDSTPKIDELLALIKMNQELYHSRLTSLTARVDGVFNERIRKISGQLLSGRYTDPIEKNGKKRWNWR